MVTKQLLLLIMGDVYICASGCKILLLLRQSSGEPSLWLALQQQLCYPVSHPWPPLRLGRAKTSSKSVTLYSSHLCFKIRIIQKPSYICSKHWKENQARDIIQALAKQLQTNSASCCSSLNQAGALSTPSMSI